MPRNKRGWSATSQMADLLIAAMPLRNRTPAEIRAALKLLEESNPAMVDFVCNRLGQILKGDE